MVIASSFISMGSGKNMVTSPKIAPNPPRAAPIAPMELMSDLNLSATFAISATALATSLTLLATSKPCWTKSTYLASLPTMAVD